MACHESIGVSCDVLCLLLRTSDTEELPGMQPCWSHFFKKWCVEILKLNRSGVTAASAFEVR